MAERRSPFFAKTDLPTKRVKFIPVRDGDLIELGATSIPGASYVAQGYAESIAVRYPHTFIGFKPGTGPKAYGWIVVLVDEAHPTTQPKRKREIPEARRRALRAS